MVLVILNTSSLKNITLNLRTIWKNRRIRKAKHVKFEIIGLLNLVKTRIEGPASNSVRTLTKSKKSFQKLNDWQMEKNDLTSFKNILTILYFTTNESLTSDVILSLRWFMGICKLIGFEMGISELQVKNSPWKIVQGWFIWLMMQSKKTVRNMGNMNQEINYPTKIFKGTLIKPKTCQSSILWRTLFPRWKILLWKEFKVCLKSFVQNVEKTNSKFSVLISWLMKTWSHTWLKWTQTLA